MWFSSQSKKRSENGQKRQSELQLYMSPLKIEINGISSKAI